MAPRESVSESMAPRRISFSDRGKKLKVFYNRFPDSIDTMEFQCATCKVNFKSDGLFMAHLNALHFDEPGFDDGTLEKRLKLSVYLCNICNTTLRIRIDSSAQQA